jgi:hypothetical protein
MTPEEIAKFRENIRGALQSNYRKARENMGLPVEEETPMYAEEDPEIGMETDLEEADLAGLLDKKANLEKRMGDLDAQIAKAKAHSEEERVKAAQAAQDAAMATEDEVHGLEERENPISVDSMQNALKFATPDQIAAAIKNMDQQELSTFVSEIQQDGLEVLVNNIDQGEGGAPEEGGEAGFGDEGDAEGQDGNLKLGDL